MRRLWLASRSPLRHLPAAQQRVIVHGLMLLLMFSAAQRWIIRPLGQRQHALQQQLDTATQRADILRSLAGTQDQLTAIRRRLPARGDSSFLVQKLATLAAAHHLIVDTVTPQGANGAGRYTRLPIRVEARGAFAHVLQFLYALHTLAAPVRIDHLDLTTASEFSADAAAPAGTPLRMQLTVSALLRDP